MFALLFTVMFCLFFKQTKPEFCTRILHMKVRFICAVIAFLHDECFVN